MLAAALAIASAAVWFVAELDQLSDRAANAHRVLEQTHLLNRKLRHAMDEQVALIHGHLHEPKPENESRLARAQLEIGRDHIAYVALPLDPSERVAVERIRALQSELGVSAQEIFELFGAGNVEEANLELVELEETLRGLYARFDELTSLQVASLWNSVDDARRTAARTTQVLAGTTLVVALALTGFVLLFRARVARPLNSLVRVAGDIERGDLRARADVRRSDEVGRLAESLNAMASSLAAHQEQLESRLGTTSQRLHEVENQLVQSAKMSAMGRLVSGVAHELNNPLTAVIGYAELALHDRDQSGNASAVHADLEQILEQAERCRHIVASLLEFARQSTTTSQPVHLNPLVVRSLELSDYDARANTIRIDHELDWRDPVVLGDARKLQQVLLILLNNAVDAIGETSSGGHIQIRTTVRSAAAVLEVVDDGPGVPDVERIFEPFFTTKEVGKGTGLGLSIAYGIINDYGGRITAENGDRGACFRIELPLGVATKRPSNGPMLAPAAHDGDPQRVLVVEDEVQILHLQSLYLEEAGYVVEARDSGQAAIEFLERENVDLIVSDVRMPGAIGGKELFAWVAQHRPALVDRFLFATGDVTALGHPESLPCRALAKPFTRDGFLSAITQILHSPATRR